MYSIKVENLDTVRKEFLKAPKQVNASLQKGVKQAGVEILSIEKREAPVGQGNLRRNILFKYRPISSMVWPSSKYAIYVHEGTGLFGPRKDYIRPKTAKVLAFRKNGKMIFAKKVAGQKPNKFVERTAKKASSKVNKIFDDMAKEIIQKI
jgi:hypothetical protein